MANDFVLYKTTVPTRLDTIAQEQYGDATKIDVLVYANPGLTIYEYIPNGVNVLCPVSDAPKTQVGVKPPWAD